MMYWSQQVKGQYEISPYFLKNFVKKKSEGSDRY